MKGLLLLALIAGVAAAQFEETDARLAECQQDCCSGMDGQWDGALQECAVDNADFNAYYKCRNECIELASRDYGSMGGGGAGICCAPMLVLPLIIFFAARNG